MKYILFDLDGTIIDSGLGITNAAAYALSKYNIIKDPKDLAYFVGPPLYDTFGHFDAIDSVQDAVTHFRDYYQKKGILECTLYDHMASLLEKLSQDHKVILATSKPEFFAKQILDHLNLSQYFYFIAGAAMDETRTKKAEVIEHIMDTCKIQDKDQMIMIGDKEHDIIGAHHHNIKAIGVLYGYGDLEALETAKADYIVKDVKALDQLLERL